MEAVLCLRWLVVGLSQRRTAFEFGPVHVLFAMDISAQGQDLLHVLQFPLVSVTPPIIHAHLNLLNYS